MKFRIDKSEFQKHLFSVSSIVPVKPVITVIANIMIEAKKGKIMFSSTDFEITVHSEMTANIETEGEVIVNAKTLVELVKRLPTGMLDLKLFNNELHIECGTGMYKLPVTNKEDYVDIIGIDKSKMFSIESLPVINAIENTLFAVSKDAIKIAITGILLEANGKELSLIGTDGHRLSVYTIKDIFEKQLTKSVIIPPKALSIVKTLITGKESFQIGFDEKRIMFKIEETEISAKLIEGTYPDYRRVIPTDNNKLLLINKEEFLDILSRVNIFTNPNTKLVKAEVEKDRIKINAYQSQTGEGTETIKAEYNEDDPFIIGFNNNYLIEVIKKIETDNLKMRLKTEMSAVIIENENNKIGEESLYLIMPLRLK